MTERFVEVDGVRLYCTESGTGIPLVFVHGWGLDSRSWDAQIKSFERRFRVIAYDWRGHGRSDLTPPYLFSALARELDGVLTALDVACPVLCGHSMGGTIVMEYAATDARPLAGLMFIDSNVPGSLSDKLIHEMRCYAGAFGADALAALIGSRGALSVASRVYGPVFWSAQWRAANPTEYAAWQRQFVHANLLGMSRAYRASAHRTDPVPRLRNLSVPALVVNGTADRVFSVRMAQRIAGSLKKSTFALIKGAGHMSMCEQPDKVNACIEGFLHQVEPGR